MTGDLLTGTRFSTQFKGELGVTLMNKMNFDAMTIGNHEFDYGLGNLLANLRPLEDFPLLSANIKTVLGTNRFQGILTKKFSDSDTRIVIFGLTTANTPLTTHPRNAKQLRFEDPTKTATEIIERVNETDLVIALTHIGVEEDKKLAESCPKIDVIIGGHSHTAIVDPIKVNQTIICQAGAYTQYVGKLDLDAVDGKVKDYKGQLIELNSAITEDLEIASILGQYKDQIGMRGNEVVGKTGVSLSASRDSVRSDIETSLGRLIAYGIIHLT
jgi:5'-nucleotidase / UDP-sugar diphosphatase